MHMTEDMLDSRLWRIDAKSSSSAATSPTSQSQIHRSSLVFEKSYL